MSNSNVTKQKTIEKVPNDKTNDILDRFRIDGSIFMSLKLFEQLYLSPQNKVKGEFR